MPRQIDGQSSCQLQIQVKKAADICETFGMDPSGNEELDDENPYLG